MNARISTVAVVVLVAARTGSPPVGEARADEPTGGNASGVAVLELFTSEGCSSCPPAENVLSNLAQSRDRGIYALAFHVDYWDELGWHDRFASPDNTARQQAYAHAFGRRDVYTPQMIVGGTEQFTGSDGDRAVAAITRALSRPPSVRISLRLRSTGPDAVRVSYEARGAPIGSMFNVAAIERAVSVSVRAGENAGRTLRHVNVVRAFLTTRVTSEAGSVVIELPPSLPRKGADLVAYVQRTSVDGSGMPVLGATRSPLADP
jgi:hypothetical protein